MSVGVNIKRVRRELGITQTELGEKLGISQSAIGQLESPNSNPKAETLQKIADALGVPVTLLLGIKEGQEINIIEPDLDELRKEYQDLCYSLTAEELQIIRKIAYAFIKSH